MPRFEAEEYDFDGNEKIVVKDDADGWYVITHLANDMGSVLTLHSAYVAPKDGYNDMREDILRIDNYEEGVALTFMIQEPDDLVRITNALNKIQF